MSGQLSHRPPACSPPQPCSSCLHTTGIQWSCFKAPQQGQDEQGLLFQPQRCHSWNIWEWHLWKYQEPTLPQAVLVLTCNHQGHHRSDWEESFFCAWSVTIIQLPLAFINLISILVLHVQAGKLQIPPLSCTSHKLITKTNVQKSINHISHTIHHATVDSYSFDPSVQQETDFHSDLGNNTSSPHVFLSLSVSYKNHYDPCDLVGMGQSIRALVLKIRMQCLDARSSISRAWHWAALLIEKTISQPYIGSSFTELACRNTALSFSLGKMWNADQRHIFTSAVCLLFSVTTVFCTDRLQISCSISYI